MILETLSILLNLQAFSKYQDNILKKTKDLPEKTFWMGVQLLKESSGKKGKLDTTTLKNIKTKYKDVFDNLNLKHYWYVQGLTNSQRDKVLKILVNGRQETLTSKQIAKQLQDEVFGKFDKKAVMVARTFITEAEAQGRIAYAEELKEQIGEEVYLQVKSAPDACPICKSILNYTDENGNIIEGKIFPISKLKDIKISNLGLGDNDKKPVIPQHFNCRCLFVISSKEKYEEQQSKKLKNKTIKQIKQIIEEKNK